MEKADLKNTAGGSVTWQYNLEQSFSAFKNAADSKDKKLCLDELELSGCSAIKLNLDDIAGRCFAAAADDDIVAKKDKVQFICSMLTAAARAKKRELFSSWFREAESAICAAMDECAETVSDFIRTMGFIICDRRYHQSFYVLRKILCRFFVQIKNKAVLCGLLNEWTILTAQIAKRKWTDVTDFLLKAVFYAVLKKNDLYFIRMLLLKLSLHFAMYSRWDGFASAFRIYKNLHIFILLLIKKAGQSKLDYYTRKQYLLISLRNVRDLIANISRTSMQEDLQIIRQWNDLLTESMGSGCRIRITGFMQLVIAYWCRTKPKTSKKQLNYLTDLLQSDVLSDDYKKMLQEIA